MPIGVIDALRFDIVRVAPAPVIDRPEMRLGDSLKATWQTLHMVAVAAVIGSAFGIPLGVFLATSGRGNSLPLRRSTASSARP